MVLPVGYPFRDRFEAFLEEYANCSTYWYVPKARTLTPENVLWIKRILRLLFDDYLEFKWNTETQDVILQDLVDRDILEPYRAGSRYDRTALVRIWKKLLETLGFLWVQHETEIVITDAGLDLIAAESEAEAISVVEAQVAKYQYPNPGLAGDYAEEFEGIIPHLFLLQVLREVGYQLSRDEYELFVNLAQSQDDYSGVVTYIRFWRDLAESEQDTLLEVVSEIPVHHASDQLVLIPEEMVPVEDGATRHRRISLNSSYQRAFYAFPRYLELDGNTIVCNAPAQVEGLLEERLQDLKVPWFSLPEDWFAYFGDPRQQPSWFTHLSLEVERAATYEEAKNLVEEHAELLDEDETQEIQRKQVEKGIEEFYAQNLSLLEPGLDLIEDGRQYSTPIGRMDLVCVDLQGEYVVVEIKAEAAEDSVFGQILRYIGWIHRNRPDGHNNVRGIILAGEFPDKARYSRIGLLKADYEEFLKFKQHKLDLTSI